VTGRAGKTDSRLLGDGEGRAPAASIFHPEDASVQISAFLTIKPHKKSEHLALHIYYKLL